MIKSEISIVIKPISSLYDLLPNDKMSNYLDELSKDFGEFIENQTINKKDSHIDDKINKLKFNSYIENTEGVFHYIIMPYKDDVLDQTYNNNIDKTKIINYEHEKISKDDYITNIIESNLRKIQKKNMSSQYIKVVYHIPLYDEKHLEFRFKVKDTKTKLVPYKDIFEQKKLDKIRKLPFVTSLEINSKNEDSLEGLLDILKKGKSKSRKIVFYETLYNYSRNRNIREDYALQSKFYKVLVLYSTDFLEKDISTLNKDYYYELPTVKIDETYFTQEENNDEKFKDVVSKYKVNEKYRCIGKLTNIRKTKYKFTLKLKELIFEEKKEDNIVFYINIDTSLLGILHRYSIESEPTNIIQIKPKNGILKVFNENDVKLLKYNNIDKVLDEGQEVFLPKEYHITEESFEDFLTKKPSPTEAIKYFKSPTELKKYEVFLQQNYQRLKNEVPEKLETNMLTYYKDFDVLTRLLFQENMLFHLKPRNSSSISNTQYKLKLDSPIKIYQYNENEKNYKLYEESFESLLNKEELKKQYKNIIYSKKPDYVIYVNLLLDKKNFKKTTLYDCKEIKFKLLKHTKRLIIGGKKLKLNKKKTYNKRCLSKKYYQRRYSRRKV
jgi:hypothetical protein